MTEAEPLVLVDVVDQVCVLSINRPGALNAADAHVAAAMSDALGRFEDTPNLRVAVVTGVGRAFCAGVDLKATARGEEVLVPEHPEWGFAGITQRMLTKPMIAAVNGLALGGGAEIVLACDLAVMSSEAWLGFPEVTRGVFAGGGGAIRLPRQVPWKIAMERLLTGERISADEALAWGLVNRITSPTEVLTAALELAQRIASNSPQSVRLTKEMALRSIGQGSTWDDDVWARNAELNVSIPLTADAVEGAAAFVERRSPVWRDA